MGINLNTQTILSLFDYAVAIIPSSLKIKIKKSKTTFVQRVRPMGWFGRNGIAKNKVVTLYKRVSKEFKTQEGTPNETTWRVGSTVDHLKWNPVAECGEGQFHACSRPYFCDEFRNIPGDRYIAIEIFSKDLHEWKYNPQYPYKIAFKSGKVRFECDRYGNKL